MLEKGIRDTFANDVYGMKKNDVRGIQGKDRNMDSGIHSKQMRQAVRTNQMNQVVLSNQANQAVRTNQTNQTVQANQAVWSNQAKEMDQTVQTLQTDQGCLEFVSPSEIEAESMRRIEAELSTMRVAFQREELSVVRRVIHSTADFDFAKNLHFSGDAVRMGREALKAGKAVITDTNMALAGVSKPSCRKYGNPAVCYMADEEVARIAKEKGTTRAYAAMGHAASLYPDGVYAIGNAPTALLRLEELIRSGQICPSLIVGVPVGFVNVVESKERIIECCSMFDIPAIVARGRKGGSGVAAAIMNALFYGIE